LCRSRSRCVREDDRSSNRAGRALAWAVHLLTATSAIFALLALAAIERERGFEALLWLFAALVVDGVDGTLARAAKVRARLPSIDGDALDLVVDYLTYVFVPAVFIWRGNYLPDSLALPLTAAILVSSLYVFARRDMKTEDGYFRGFPALWNIIAFYFFVAPLSQEIAAAVVVMFTLMTFAPVHAVHPFRVRDYGWILPGLAIVWAAITAALLLPNWSSEAETVLLTLSLAAAAVLVAMGFWRTFRGPRSAQ
jgi:phosphatidylcholine synthase